MTTFGEERDMELYKRFFYNLLIDIPSWPEVCARHADAGVKQKVAGRHTRSREEAAVPAG